jgi:hypothetical protein
MPIHRSPAFLWYEGQECGEFAAAEYREAVEKARDLTQPE